MWVCSDCVAGELSRVELSSNYGVPEPPHLAHTRCQERTSWQENGPISFKVLKLLTGFSNCDLPVTYLYFSILSINLNLWPS